MKKESEASKVLKQIIKNQNRMTKEAEGAIVLRYSIKGFTVEVTA